MTTGFVDAAQLMAATLGMTGYRFAVIGHPISSADDGALAAKAADTLRQATALLLQPED